MLLAELVTLHMQDKADMMSQLEVMEREDRSRRQKALSNMPVRK